MVGYRNVIAGFNVGEHQQTLVVDVLWGIDSINKDGVDGFNASDIGRVNWDQDFDPSPPQNQQQLFDFCQEMKLPKHNLLFAKDSIQCWIVDFAEYMEDDGLQFPVKIDDQTDK